MAFRRGTARASDHAQLVHHQWFHVVRLNASIFVKRVATDDNIADLPSREVAASPWGGVQTNVLLLCLRIQEFRTSLKMGALEVEPALAVEYHGDAWALLQRRWSLV